MDRLETLRVFRKVADRQSFSAAARELGLSNAGVSKHIARLEADREPGSDLAAARAIVQSGALLDLVTE